MQRQNINLFKQFKRPSVELEYLSWKHFQLATIIFIGICLSIYILYFADMLYQSFALKWETSKLDKLHIQYAQVKSKYPSFFFTENVEHIVSELQTNVGLQTDLLHTVANRYQFSENLLTLSRVITTNVWLTDINIEDGGSKTTLKGLALTMQELQQFINNLSLSQLYSGSRLTIDDIENPSGNQEAISFTISMVAAR